MIIRRAKPEEAEVLTQLAVRSKRSWGYDDAFMSAIANDMIVRSDYLKNEMPSLHQGTTGLPVTQSYAWTAAKRICVIFSSTPRSCARASAQRCSITCSRSHKTRVQSYRRWLAIPTLWDSMSGMVCA
ncbi:MAG: hypothetical protein M3160_08075 [Candidatus Eremiobacteraeota bacterium]|nr:hypothetical protein [Candidatus Eremiobacteraeota bacterium]